MGVLWLIERLKKSFGCIRFCFFALDCWPVFFGELFMIRNNVDNFAVISLGTRQDELDLALLLARLIYFSKCLAC